MALSFNLQGALQATLNPSLCGAGSSGTCAKSVRIFLEHGGLDTSGRPVWAQHYVRYLPTIGFRHIGTIANTQAQTAFTTNGVQPGDIAVYQKPGAPNEPGHICMWNGRNWCSDFRQNHMNVYRSRGDVAAYIFRWSGEVSNAPIDLSSFGTSGAFGISTPDELTGEGLAAQAPDKIEFKGMWSRYQLKMGRRSPIISQYMNMSGTIGGSNVYTGGDYGSGSNAITTAQADANAMEIMKFFVSKGLTPEQASGFVGCWGAESMCNPHAYNKAEKAGRFKGSSANGAGYGAGLAQWSHGWKADLQRMMGRMDPIENWDLYTQLTACWEDLQRGNKSRFLNVLRDRNDPVGATDAVLRGYENGGNGKLASVAQIDKYTWCGGYNGAMNTRVSFAKKWLQMYNAQNTR